MNRPKYEEVAKELNTTYYPKITTEYIRRLDKYCDHLESKINDSQKSSDISPIKRITYNDEAEKELDEVLVEDVQIVYIERMDKGRIWMAIYPKNGPRLVVNFYTKRNGMIEGHAELGA